MDVRLTFYLGQVESGSNIGLFPKFQVFIFTARSNSSSYTSIRKIFKTCNDEARFLDSPGIEPAKVADQRIYPTSIECNFKRLYLNNLVREFND
jgi:hypothetical protein